ncbi:uncharacterized protein BJ212DRAFT_1303893 [Suillus subaureus]|uniref:Uncharacterized protein n=1 Tax=Suillus subaureus TaxID=48587 RepID=A0A9P7J6Z9_9AGAM|nr:uncharacterized protein BJ212DRAFT_1303893 [Suillus subaureus]KAG1805828.1 hypothetical protein BJ212DRAFT_1303893 [Suillus subaureus]
MRHACTTLSNSKHIKSLVQMYMKMYMNQQATPNYIITSAKARSCTMGWVNTSAITQEILPSRFNYTTYDVRWAQDIINPKTPHCNIMLLKYNHDDGGHGGDFLFAKVISIHHINVVGMNAHKVTHGTLALWAVFISGLSKARMLSVLWTQELYLGHVILYQPLLEASRIQVKVEFPLLQGIGSNWLEYYINSTSFVDCDTMMHFHYGLGVGHLYFHNVRVVETPSSPISAQTLAQMVDKHLEARGSLGKATQWQALADEEDEEDHAGVEELDFFNNGLNASTESMINTLDEMFTTGHTFDYEN